VRETLQERLKNLGPERADEILSFSICEPAMGSAASSLRPSASWQTVTWR
jgi:hypothetical protein